MVTEVEDRLISNYYYFSDITKRKFWKKIFASKNHDYFRFRIDKDN